MKTFFKLALVVALLSTLNSQLPTALAQGTAFTYQGRLNDGVAPANGIYDLRFTVFDAAVGGFQVPWVTNFATVVSNGLFTATLDLGNVFYGDPRWLEIAVRTNGGGGFTILDPRQALTPTPYAIFAGGASNLIGAVSSANLAGTYSQAVTLNNPGNVFTGNGGGVTNVNAAQLNGLNSTNFWKLGGNNVAAGQFLGSINNQPVEIRVNNVRALRLESDGAGLDAPNVIGGSSANNVVAGNYGSTIAGGGRVGYPNSIDAGWATIGGGYGNTIQTNAGNSTIGGGVGNTIQTNATYSTIGGGGGNTIQNDAADSTIGGGFVNSIAANAFASTIGGGYLNTIQTNAFQSTIGGGIFNTIQTGAVNSTIGGGYYNIIQTGAVNSTIGGGFGNTNGGFDATVPGGGLNAALGDFSFAAGRQAKAIHQGAFVWADSTLADFSSTAQNQFAVRANGGVLLNMGANNLEIASGGLKATGAGINTGTFAFTQRAVGTNTSGNITTIYNPICDNNPNAILLVTHNYSADTNSASAYNLKVVGVYYNGSRWTIFNEDQTAMALGRAFNVLIVKP